jgi:hypothetical protein
VLRARAGRGTRLRPEARRTLTWGRVRRDRQRTPTGDTTSATRATVRSAPPDLARGRYRMYEAVESRSNRGTIRKRRPAPCGVYARNGYYNRSD